LPKINALDVPNRFPYERNLALSGVHLSVDLPQGLVVNFCNRFGITLLPAILTALSGGWSEQNRLGTARRFCFWECRNFYAEEE
jgi:hypothetical protein